MKIWIAIVVAVLLAAAPQRVAEPVDAQTISSLVDDDALLEYVLVAEPLADPLVRAPVIDDLALPSPLLDRVFRPPRHSFA